MICLSTLAYPIIRVFLVFLFCFLGATFVKRIEMKRYCAQNLIFTVKLFQRIAKRKCEFWYNDKKNSSFFLGFITLHMSSFILQLTQTWPKVLPFISELYIAHNNSKELESEMCHTLKLKALSPYNVSHFQKFHFLTFSNTLQFTTQEVRERTIKEQQNLYNSEVHRYDQHRISPFSVNAIPSRKVAKIKRIVNCEVLPWCTAEFSERMFKNAWQLLRRIKLLSLER